MQYYYSITNGFMSKLNKLHKPLESLRNNFVESTDFVNKSFGFIINDYLSKCFSNFYTILKYTNTIYYKTHIPKETFITAISVIKTYVPEFRKNILGLCIFEEEISQHIIDTVLKMRCHEDNDDNYDLIVKSNDNLINLRQTESAFFNSMKDITMILDEMEEYLDEYELIKNQLMFGEKERKLMLAIQEMFGSDNCEELANRIYNYKVVLDSIMQQLKVYDPRDIHYEIAMLMKEAHKKSKSY